MTEPQQAEIFRQQKQRIISLLNTLTEIARPLNGEVDSQLAAARKRVETDQLAVAVVGECKRGKSTLLNNLLGRDYCPVDVTVATCVVTVIRKASRVLAEGTHETITVHLGEEGDAPSSIAIPISELPQYASENGNPGNCKKVRSIEVDTDAPAVSDGLVFLDTPGVGGMNPAHTRVTIEALVRSDVVVYVLDATSPLSTVEIEFVKNRLKGSHRLLFVLTKKDLSPDLSANLANNRSKLSELVGLDPADMLLVPVNNLAFQTYRKSNDPEDLAQSNMPEFQQALWTLLRKQRGAIILGSALETAENVCRHLELPLRSEFDALSKESVLEMNHHKMALESEKKRREALLSGQASWVGLLQHEIQLLQSNLMGQLNQGFIEVNRLVNQRLEDATIREDPAAFQQLVTQDLNDLSYAIEAELEVHSRKIYSQLAGETKLTLTEIDARFNPNLSFSGWDSIQLPKRGWFAKALDVARSAYLPYLTLGAAAAKFALAPLAPVIAWVLFRDAVTAVAGREKAEAIRHLMGIIQPELQKVRNTYDTQLRNTLAELSKGMRDDLQQAIHEEAKAIEESLARIASVAKSSDEERQKRLASITKPLNELQGILKAILPLKATVNAGVA